MYKRIALISDLHLDNWLYKKRTPVVEMYQKVIDKCLAQNVDLIVNAGDIQNNSATTPTMVVSKTDMLYVPGNHDYYENPLPTQPLFWKDEQIAATTLWSNFDGDAGGEEWVYGGILDKSRIRNTGAYRVQNLCNQSFAMLQDLNREIVVTHFPPSRQSTADQYRGNPYNSYFVNNFDRQIEDKFATKLWMFGHVHHKHAYMIGSCLCVCNPLGNSGELYSSIDEYQPTILVKEDDQWRVESN